MNFRLIAAFYLTPFALIFADVGTTMKELIHTARRRRSDAKIVNGNNAPKRRYSYFVSIQTIIPHIRHRCGGTLIAPDIVLSAGHCFMDIAAVAVRTNVNILDKPSSGSEIFSVPESVRHPEFGQNTGIDKDFWVLKLSGNSRMRYLRINNESIIPSSYEGLAVMGFGTIKYGQDKPPNILQIANKSIYISNSECVGMTIGGSEGEYNATLATTVTDDMMCAYESGQGACQGDSGGPLILEGDYPDEDLQVGIVSWGVNCARSDYPGVYSRISWGYEFIRSQVCYLSDKPPKYMMCGDIEASLAPSLTSKDTKRINVLIQITLDENPTETSWIIWNQWGEIIHEVPIFSYKDPFTSVTERVALEVGNEFKVALIDSFGDGMSSCCPIGEFYMFLGEYVDFTQVLVYFDGDFESFVNTTFTLTKESTFPVMAPNILPSLSPIPSASPTQTSYPTGDLQVVTLFIQFDTYSSVDVSWNISTLDGRIVKEVARGAYNPFDHKNATELITLEQGLEYIFSIRDEGGDGLCCESGSGYVEIYYGRKKSPKNLILYDRGDFAYDFSQSFIVEKPQSSTPSVYPSQSSIAPSSSISPTSTLIEIIVQLRFGCVLQRIGWIISSKTEGILLQKKPGYYADEKPNSTIRHTTNAALGMEYDFSLLGFEGKEKKCNGKHDDVTIYLKEVAKSSVILKVDMDKGIEGNTSFIASPFGLLGTSPMSPLERDESSFPSTMSNEGTLSEPFAAEVFSPPSPATKMTFITLIVRLDRFPEENEVVMYRNDKARSKIFDWKFSEKDSSKIFKKKLTLNKSWGRNYVLEVYDKIGDGICCRHGYGNLTIYLGKENSGKVLLDENGDFGHFLRRSFLVSPEGILKGNPSQSLHGPTGQGSISKKPSKSNTDRCRDSKFDATSINGTKDIDCITSVTPSPAVTSENPSSSMPINFENSQNGDTSTAISFSKAIQGYLTLGFSLLLA